MRSEPLRVAALGMGWWSDVLADAVKRSGELELVACYTRSNDKRHAFATKYGCRAAASYEETRRGLLSPTASPRQCNRPRSCVPVLQGDTVNFTDAELPERKR